MPKRSDRDVFPGVFAGNPFHGMNPKAIYKEIQWGNTPKEIIDIDAPEALVSLGTLAKLKLLKNSINVNKDCFNLAIGCTSNILYIFPVDERIIPELDDNWGFMGLVKQTDYYSDKGGEECYYYHKHEKPYPALLSHMDTSVHIIVPQDFNGQRSYAVIKEGIVG